MWVDSQRGHEILCLHCDPVGSGVHPTSFSSGTCYCFPRGGDEVDVKTITHLRLVLRLRMLGAIPPSPSCLDDVHKSNWIFTSAGRILIRLIINFTDISGISVLQPCIHTFIVLHLYSYNKSQRDALFLIFIFDKELYIFIKNKFEKECISLAFIIRIYHNARSSECQIIYIFLWTAEGELSIFAVVKQYFINVWW